MRYQTFLTEIRPVVFELTLPEYLRIIMLVALIWLPAFALAGMYNIGLYRRHVDELGRVFLGCSTGLVVIVLLIFFRHELFGSRFIVLFGWMVSIILVFAGRVAVRTIQRSLFKKGMGVRRVVIIGQGKNADNFIKAIKNDPKSGYRIVRHISNLDQSSLGFLHNIAKSKSADTIIQADPDIKRSQLLYLWQFCQDNHLDFSYVADTLEAKVKNIQVWELGGMPIVQIKRTPLDGWGRIVKRIFDIMFSLTVIIPLIPVSLVISLIIKFDSAGPVFVRLKRVGESGNIFELFKFRSMIVGADNMKDQLQIFNERSGGPLFKMTNDPRVTRAGKILRQYSLDEFPNFLNVLRGQMSVIGPRPHEPNEVSQYQGTQKRLLTIKPGVSGLAQISGRSDLSFEEEAKLDLFYIESWSFWLDMQIILRTVRSVIRGKSAV